MKKVLSIFGTRPEAIKMAPVVKELESREGIESVVCVTAQHRDMLDQVLEIFKIKPDYDLNIMKPGQTLTHITAEVLKGIEEVYNAAKQLLDGTSVYVKMSEAKNPYGDGFASKYIVDAVEEEK